MNSRNVQKNKLFNFKSNIFIVTVNNLKIIQFIAKKIVITNLQLRTITHNVYYIYIFI